MTPLSLAALRVPARAGFTLPPALANNATATLPGLRWVVTCFFSARRFADAIPMIEDIAGELLDATQARIDSTGSCVLLAAFAQPLPCRVLMELPGIRGIAPATLIRRGDAALEPFYRRAVVLLIVNQPESSWCGVLGSNFLAELASGNRSVYAR
ncbi:cytochrome P450 [Streptomyces sp. NBC_00631]|uniref:hypothetical protein n=1 Tax=Streptomyces sp. NBC_00631 TaxID=2975793 RepID=UPI0030E3D081